MVTITGTNLINPTSVTVGGNPATVSASTATTITVVTPAGSVGVGTVVVSTPGGTATRPSAFTYRTTATATAKVKSIDAPSSIPVMAAEVSRGPSEVRSASPQQSRVSGTAVVSASVDCNLSLVDYPRQRCFTDSDSDAGASTDGEIVYTDAYVAKTDKTQLVIDVVPYDNISSDTWLVASNTHLRAYFDLNADNVFDVLILAPDAVLAAGNSTTAYVYDRNATSNTYVPRDGGVACSTTLTRANTTHFAFPTDVGKQWWQFKTDWSCIVGSSLGAVDIVTYLADSLNASGSDFAPNTYGSNVLNFTGLTQAAPTASSMTPASGSNAGGSQVTISGSGMSDVSSVTFGGLASAIVSQTASEMVVTVPRSNSTGAVDVLLTGPGGSAALSSGFTYTSTAPTIESVSPNTGSTAGGTSVTITGSNLDDVTTVMFGNANGTIVSATSTTLVVTSPAQGSGFTPVVPTETAYTNGTLWGLTGTYGVGASDAWKLTQGVPSVVVAVLDTGVTAHPDLGPQVAGYDMISSTAVSNDGDGVDANPSDPGDWCASESKASSWHGTHVQGTVNASINGVGSVGLAPEVKVQPVRVLGTCGGSTYDIAMGIYWAAGASGLGVPVNSTPAKVISMSLGGFGLCSATEQAAIDYAYARNIVVTVAAGNENADSSAYSPGNCDHVITVAATDSSGKRGSFSNYGSTVEIAAPGVAIYSTVNTGTTVPASSSYISWNGTSMATPHVAAVVALMLSRQPNLTPDQVLDRIRRTSLTFGGGVCDPVAAKTCGAGILNARVAVQ